MSVARRKRGGDMIVEKKKAAPGERAESKLNEDDNESGSGQFESEEGLDNYEAFSEQDEEDNELAEDEGDGYAQFVDPEDEEDQSDDSQGDEERDEEDDEEVLRRGMLNLLMQKSSLSLMTN